MGSLAHFGRTLVIAPHPDDEVLGCGGTIARLADEGEGVEVCIVTQGKPPAYAPADVERVTAETLAAHAIIGVSKTHRLDFPAAALDTVAAADLNSAIGRLVEAVRPDTLLLPFVGDIHGDHQRVFQAAMVAARPRHNSAPRRIYCYETLSETNWYAPPMTPAFVPTCFIDISRTLDRKLDGFRAFASQVRPWPEERSLESLEALARMRGATVHCDAAEAFIIVREIISAT